MTLHLTTSHRYHTSRVAARRGRRLRASHWRVFLAIVLSLCAGLSLSSSIHADEEDEEVVAVVAERQFVITEQQFDQMLFGGQQVVQQANGRAMIVSQPNGTDFRKRMEATVAVEIQAVDRRVSLTEAQKKKLQLAGRGDIHQFFSRVSELRPKLTSKPLSRQQYVELKGELQLLRMATQSGTFGEGSLFQKTLRRALSDEQRARYRVLERERQVRMVESVVSDWDRNANGVKLLINNRHKFVEVLVEHGHLPQAQNPYRHYFVLFEAVRLEDRLKPLLTEENWEKLQTQAAQAKQAEAELRNSGHWPMAPEDDEEQSDKTKE